MKLTNKEGGAPNRIQQSLCSASAYSHDADTIQCLETHISWIFLTGKFAYKVKKPVALGFVNFSTLALRKHFCEEELRLNRRFAPNLYHEVVTINQRHGELVVDGEGTIVDYAVKMRQFPQDALLSHLCENNKLTDNIIDQVAQKIAKFHLSMDASEMSSDSVEAIKHSVFSNLDEILKIPCLPQDKEPLHRIHTHLRQQFPKLIPFFEQRQKSGCIRDCHGDLHLGNIAYIDGEITLFDCIEFNAAFRHIDIICDVAFTLMDLNFRQRTNQANRLLNQYLELTGEYRGLPVLRFYQLHLALVRAKVALIQANQGQSPPSSHCERYLEFQAYLDLADRFLQAAPPFIILMSGLSGSGKSTVAAQLAHQSGAIRIRSDVERKRIFNLGALDSSSNLTDIDIYSDAATKDTFSHLKNLTTLIIQSGYCCIVDATFIHQDQRSDFIQLSKSLQCSLHIVYCHAKQSTLEKRIEQRALSRRDPSEADISVLHTQIDNLDPFSDEEQQYLYDVDTDTDVDTSLIMEYLGMKDSK